jgi:hypothetical protein
LTGIDAEIADERTVTASDHNNLVIADRQTGDAERAVVTNLADLLSIDEHQGSGDVGPNAERALSSDLHQWRVDVDGPARNDVDGGHEVLVTVELDADFVTWTLPVVAAGGLTTPPRG